MPIDHDPNRLHGLHHGIGEIVPKLILDHHEQLGTEVERGDREIPQYPVATTDVGKVDNGQQEINMQRLLIDKLGVGTPGEVPCAVE